MRKYHIIRKIHTNEVECPFIVRTIKDTEINQKKQIVSWTI